MKESSDAKQYLQQLEELLPQAQGDAAKKIEKEIAATRAGISGEDNILFELKNSGMDMVVLHDLYLESASGLSAQIDFLVLTPKIFLSSSARICTATSRSTARAISSAPSPTAAAGTARVFIRPSRKISGMCR